MTTATHIPAGFQAITPYLMVRDARAFEAFLTRALDAQTLQLTEHEGRITHMELRALGCVLELSEAQAEGLTTRVALHCFVPDPDAVMQRMLDAGATELYAMTEHPYGERSGGVEDAWGNQWYIARMTDAKARQGD